MLRSASLLPIAALDQLWRFVYSQIPLKDGVDRTPAMLVANVSSVVLCSWLVGSHRRGHDRVSQRVGPELLAAIAAAGVGLCAAVGAAPPVYIACLLLAAPATSLRALRRRRLR